MSANGPIKMRVVEMACLPDDVAVVATPERMMEIRRAVSDRMDLMIRAAMGLQMPPPEPSVFVWPPARKPSPYDLIVIRNIA